MRYSRHILIMVFGLLTGVSIAVYRITHWTGSAATIVNGPWRGSNLDNVGSNQLLTARIAVAALYALRTDETIYLVAKEDDKGRPLSAKYDYVVRGWPLSSRYWSITLYGSDYFLVRNEEGRYGYNMANLEYESDSSFTIRISPRWKDGNWLPSCDEGNFYLALRLYHPEKRLYENIRTVRLPSIERVE